uniref:Microtubule-associated protein futsch-like n=1 Tax=Globodera pallida TaxID=36090 RepID=A0A183C157_GLOPA
MFTKARHLSKRKSSYKMEKLFNQLVRNAKAQHTTEGTCKCFTCAVKLHLGNDNSGNSHPPGSLNFNVDPANPGPCSLPDNCPRSSREISSESEGPTDRHVVRRRGEPTRSRKRTATTERSAPKEKAPAVTRPDGSRLHSRTLLPLPENRERPAEFRATPVEGSSSDPWPVKCEELDKYVRKLELERNFVRKEEVKKAAQLALEAFCRYIDYSS